MFPELATERFLLTQVQPGDQAFLFQGLSDPVAMPHNGVYFSTFEETRIQLEWYERNYNTGTGISWKIVSKSTGDKIGVVSVYYYKPEHKKAEVGYWILPEFWNQGIISEVLQTVIKYWQEEKKLHRLEAMVEEENTGSIRVLEKAGFLHEGTMRDYEIKFGNYINLRMYSLLSDDQTI